MTTQKLSPEQMSHDILLAERDAEWYDSKDDSPLMRSLCKTMRECSAEEYRSYLLKRDGNVQAS